MTASITEFTGSDTNDPRVPGPEGSHRRRTVVLVVVGLTLMAIVVAGAIFMFAPFADAAGSCGG
ncbi:MAG TPA: hypothetical protein VKB69_01745 [Micromonosporaceae bacterium]|nr:hypothetical protein [Micromonosporaceae bacterium]